MRRLDASAAECLVFTFKEGLLSAVAHDLEIRVTAFDVEVDEEKTRLTARFDPRSLRVVAALHDGRKNPNALSEADRRKIDESIANDVLHTKERREIRFELKTRHAVSDGWQLDGDLELNGRKKSILVTVRTAGDRYVAETTLHQPDFGIKPFSAMLGALKIRPDVKVRFSAPKW
jgi:polyisoprenoid-binding protein YceI